MRKIRVAQVITRLDWGGSPDIVRIICNNLDSALYEQALIIGDTRFLSQKSEEFLKTFKGKVFVLRHLVRDIRPCHDLLAFLQLYILLRRQKFDIVHTHTAKAGALGRLAAALCKVPVIVHTPHGHNFYGYFTAAVSKMIILIERFLASLTDIIIALTKLEKGDYRRLNIAAENKIRVIYPGLELEEAAMPREVKAKIREDFGINPDNKIIGMVSRLEPVKGPMYFIAAAGQVAKVLPQVRFVVVGEGSLRPALEERAKALGLKNNFIFTGWRQDAFNIISVLDALIQPSLNEAVGMVLIQAQALGIPVVATRVGGIPEIVCDKLTGILVQPKDCAGLAGAIVSLLSDEAARVEMSRRAQSWVKDKFRAVDMASALSQLYQELIKKRRTGYDY